MEEAHRLDMMSPLPSVSSEICMDVAGVHQSHPLTYTAIADEVGSHAGASPLTRFSKTAVISGKA